VIEGFIEGRPAPKGSRIRARSVKGNDYTFPASKFEKPWTDAVKREVQLVMRHAPTMQPPYRIELEFVIERPHKPTYEWPTKADLDKLERCVIDGIVQGKGISDDRHVTALTSSKRFAESGERQGVRFAVSEDRKVQELPVAV
jgi:Holliday junction resolvase RusA-like endonuclease